MKPTQEQIIAWAREAGGDDWGLFRDFMPEIERLSTLAYEAGRNDENEACMGICKNMMDAYPEQESDYAFYLAAEEIAAQIRAGKEQ